MAKHKEGGISEAKWPVSEPKTAETAVAMKEQEGKIGQHPLASLLIPSHDMRTLTQFMQSDRHSRHVHTACPSELEEEIEEGAIN